MYKALLISLSLVLSAGFTTGLVSAEEENTVVKAVEKKETTKPAEDADAIARKLANPNSPLASLNLKIQFRTFEGDVANADDQKSMTILFQPSLPFPLANGDKILWRPAVPILFDQPVFDLSTGQFDGEAGIGDIVFDLMYSPATEGGLMLGFGIIAGLPTASDDLGSDLWTLGPEFLIGRGTKTSFIGILANHQWDVAGSGSGDVSLFTAQVFATFLPGGGWNYGSAPIITYDTIAEQWTIPLNVNIGRTVSIKGSPWKLSFEVNYYLDKSDAIGPEMMFGFNITPVVENKLAAWFR